MPLVNTSIPNLIQGVSQQPDAVRYEGQCEEQVNAVGSLTQGLMKRPPTEFISSLYGSEISENAFVGFIDRDEDEIYTVVIETGLMKVFHTQTGTQATIDGLSSKTLSSTDYLYSTNPRKNIKMLTLGDTTFLLNTQVVTDMDDTERSTKLGTGGTDGERRAVVFVRQGGYKTEYEVDLLNADGTVAADSQVTSGASRNSDNTPLDQNATTSTIRDLIWSGFLTTQEQQAYDITQMGVSSLKMTLPAGGSLVTSDGIGDKGLGQVFEEVDKITDLPIYCIEGFKIKVRGTEDSEADDFYVKFRTSSGTNSESDYTGETEGRGVWVETTGPEEYVRIKGDTMPQILQLNNFSETTSVGTFVLTSMQFDDKLVGDSDSNPSPSFIGSSLDNIFLFKNRLGFLSGSNVIMTEAGLGSVTDAGIQKYNFFRNTVQTLLDGDPIDLQVSSERVTFLKHAIQFQNDLVLFSDNGQFILEGRDLLTPRTVSVTRATTYESDNSINPLGVGQYIYFPFARGSHTGIKEFMVNVNNDIYAAEEITSHVPSYIPNQIVDMTASEPNGMIAITNGKASAEPVPTPDINDSTGLVSSETHSDIFIYKYFFNGQKKLLGAWSKFNIVGSVRGMKFVKSVLYIVITKNGKTELLELNLKDSPIDSIGFNTNLDMRVYTNFVTGSTNNTFTMPYTPEAGDVLEAYATDGSRIPIQFTTGSNTITLTSEIPTTNGTYSYDLDTNAVATSTSTNTESRTPVFIGLKYVMKFTFNELVFKATQGQNKTPSKSSKLMLKNGAIFYEDTANFKVHVTPKLRDTQTSEFTPTIIGSSSIGTLTLEDGHFQFPIYCSAEDTKITIENDSALPSNLQSAEFESFIHTRSSRYG